MGCYKQMSTIKEGVIMRLQCIYVLFVEIAIMYIIPGSVLGCIHYFFSNCLQQGLC